MALCGEGEDPPPPWGGLTHMGALAFRVGYREVQNSIGTPVLASGKRLSIPPAHPGAVDRWWESPRGDGGQREGARPVGATVSYGCNVSMSLDAGSGVSPGSPGPVDAW